LGSREWASADHFPPPARRRNYPFDSEDEDEFDGDDFTPDHDRHLKTLRGVPAAALQCLCRNLAAVSSVPVTEQQPGPQEDGPEGL